MEINQTAQTQPNPSTFGRTVRYILRRALRLGICVVFSIFLVIILTNIGVIKVSDMGYESFTHGWFSGYRAPVTQANEVIKEMTENMYYGVEGFWPQTLVLLFRGLTFDFDESIFVGLFSDMVFKFEIKQIIGETLARTALVFGFSNLLLFAITIAIALRISQKPGGLVDRLISYLSPLNSIPLWIIGMYITILMLRWFKFYAGGLWENWPLQWNWGEVVSVLKYVIPLALAVLVGKLFQGIYLWRTFFMLNADENYIELAEAKGLPKKRIFRSYIIRPALTPLVVRLTLVVVGIWQEAIILEIFYKIVGIGWILYEALRASDFPLIISLVTTFGLLIGFTLLIAEIACAVFDPRVMTANQGKTSVIVPKLKRRIRRSGDQPSMVIPSPAQKSSDWKANLKLSLQEMRTKAANQTKRVLRAPSAVIGILILVFLFVISILPYSNPSLIFRDDPWEINPNLGSPAWVNFFRRDKLPDSLALSTTDGSVEKTVEAGDSEGLSTVTMNFEFDYPFDRVPQDLVLLLDPVFDRKSLLVDLVWFTPDGREIEIDTFTIKTKNAKLVNLPQGDAGRTNPGDSGIDPLVSLFCLPGETQQTVRGTYRLQLTARLFEPEADLDATLKLVGKVYGIAGTDAFGYDLLPSLLAGAPTGFAYGILAAFLSVAFTIIIAALSAWFGGFVDDAIQWLAEVVMITPMYPVLMLLTIYFEVDAVIILVIAVLMSVFGAGVKTYRSIFSNIKQEGYIEAGIAYGAGNWRLIWKYMLPRIVSLAIPEIVVLVPSFVFLQTTLTFLGIRTSPKFTWGWMIYEAYVSGRLGASAHTVLEPMALLLLLALAFVLLGRFMERELAREV